jgi:hypothetical protein
VTKQIKFTPEQQEEFNALIVTLKMLDKSEWAEILTNDLLRNRIIARDDQTDYCRLLLNTTRQWVKDARLVAATRRSRT